MNRLKKGEHTPLPATGSRGHSFDQIIEDDEVTPAKPGKIGKEVMTSEPTNITQGTDLTYPWDLIVNGKEVRCENVRIRCSDNRRRSRGKSCRKGDRARPLAGGTDLIVQLRRNVL